MRFTLPKLFLAVTLAAVACAGMIMPTHAWASSIVSLSIGMFAFAAFRAIGLRGRERVFAITFAVVGSVYLLAVLIWPSRILARMLVTNYPIAIFAVTQNRVATFPAVPVPGYSPPYYVPPSTVVPGDAYSSPSTSSSSTYDSPVILPIPVSAPPPNVPMLPVSQTATPLEAVIVVGLADDDERWPLFRTFLIGHCVWSWLIALFAAWFAGRMYAKRMAESSTGSNPNL